MIVTSASLCPSYPPPRAQINTIGDLLEYSPENLLELKNFGRKSADEVFATLKNKLGIVVAHGGGGCHVDSCCNHAANALPAAANDAALPTSCRFRCCRRRRRAATALSAAVLPRITPHCHRQPLPPGCHPHRLYRVFDGSEGLGAFAYNKPTKKEKGNMAPISFIEIIYIY
jgi:hypothetical protein